MPARKAKYMGLREPLIMRPGRAPWIWGIRRAARLAAWAECSGCTTAQAVEREHETRTWKRREVLAAAGTSLITSPSLRGAWGDEPIKGIQQRAGAKVVIVGAGLAGLVAADSLRKAGVHAQVYEAARRTGGRVLSANGLILPGVVTDLGGEFVDSDHKALRGLARDLGIELVDMATDPDASLAHEAYFFEAHHRTGAEVMEAFRPFTKRIEGDARNVGDLEERPLGQAALKLDRLSVAEYLDAIDLREGWFRKLLEVMFTAEFGLDPGELSALNLMMLVPTDVTGGQSHGYGNSDERYKLRGGSGAVTDALTARIADRLEYGRRLVALRGRAGGGYTLVFSGPGATSSEVAADLVILALPFSVLRSVEMRVEIPPRKRRAINELGYGTNTKVVAGFRSRPWRAAGYLGSTFSDERFLTAWDSSRLQNEPEGSGTLTLFLGGRAGVTAGEGTAGQQLAGLLPGVEKTYPGMSDAYNGRVERYHWPRAPLALGSYSCYKPGQWTAFSGVEGEPVGGLIFAGEHCQAQDAGYMDSAVRSGRRAARLVLSRIRGGNDDN